MLHTWFGAQTWPHCPQLLGSMSRRTHELPHSSSPLGQLRAQLPFAQTLPEGQTLPHMPQLKGSLSRLTQRPAQQVRPTVHGSSQLVASMAALPAAPLEPPLALPPVPPLPAAPADASCPEDPEAPEVPEPPPSSVAPPQAKRLQHRTAMQACMFRKLTNFIILF